MDSAMDVFETSKAFPVDERYSMTHQVRPSSRSAAASIADAWRRRRYAAAWVGKLNDAQAEAAETQTHLELARRCQYPSDQQAFHLDQQYEEIIAMLATMSNYPEKWRIA